MRWINIVPLFPERLDDMIAKAIRVSKETGFREHALMLTLHAEGLRPTEKLEFVAPLYAKFRAGLKAAGLSSGILFQTTVGHNAVSCQSPLPFQHAILNDGTQSRWCMQDPAYRAYLHGAIRMLLKEQPEFLIIDDDFRLSHGTNRVECFCPMHTALFNRLNGTHYTPEMLREAFNQSAQDSDFRTAFEKMQLYSLSETAEGIRRVIDEFHPEIQAIFCLSGHTASFAGTLAKIFAGSSASPAVRIDNGMFLERDFKMLPFAMQRAEFLRRSIAHIPEALDESDTCPHNRYSKCIAGLHAHLTGAVLSGLTGGKLWLTPTDHWDDVTDRRYYAHFARFGKFYDVLEQTMRCVRRDLGINNAANAVKFISEANWTAQVLGLFGIPVQCEPVARRGIQTIAGARTAEGLSDSEIRTLLHGKLLLDGPAAAVFCARGFGALLGVRVAMEKYAFSTELDDRGIAMNTIWGRFPTARLSDPATGAEVLSELRNVKFTESTEATVVAPGATVFTNAVGGRIAVTARCVDLKELQLYMLTPPIKAFLIRLLERLDPEALPYVVSEEQECYCQLFELMDGDRLFSVFNLSYDPINGLPIRTKKTVKSVKKLTIDGLWEEVDWQRTPSGITADVVFAAYEPVVLRITEEMHEPESVNRRNEK